MILCGDKKERKKEKRKKKREMVDVPFIVLVEPKESNHQPNNISWYDQCFVYYF